MQRGGVCYIGYSYISFFFVLGGLLHRVYVHFLLFVVRYLLTRLMAPRNYVIAMHSDGLRTFGRMFGCATRHMSCIRRVYYALWSRTCRPCFVPGFSPSRGVHLVEHYLFSQAGRPIHALCIIFYSKPHPTPHVPLVASWRSLKQEFQVRRSSRNHKYHTV